MNTALLSSWLTDSDFLVPLVVVEVQLPKVTNHFYKLCFMELQGMLFP